MRCEDINNRDDSVFVSRQNLSFSQNENSDKKKSFDSLLSTLNTHWNNR